ncbi:MAG: ribonuclease III, partial [Clostridiales bacterium]|nr:ribonuclease III [Clostridiales bacterium]
AREFILSFTRRNVSEAAERAQPHDYKTALQEIVQKNREETITYRLVAEEGPHHDRRFTVELLLNSNVIATGRGNTKKNAEQAAAHDALKLMGF